MEKVKTKFGAQTIILSLALLIALPVRVYQYLHVIDGTTGFYNNWLHPTVFGLYALALLVVVLVIVFSVKGGDKAIYAMPSGKRPGLATASLLSGAAFLAVAASCAYRLHQITNSTLSVQQLVLGDNVGKATAAFLAIEAVAAVLSAVFLFTAGVSYFSGKAQYKTISVLAAAPAVWCVARLMLAFTQTISYRYVSELLFEMLMIVFMAMFFVAFAKLTVGALQTRVQLRIFAYGFLSIFFALLTAIPRYIILLMGRQDVLYRPAEAFEIADVCLPIFIAVVIFAVASCKQYKAVEEYTGSETEEQAD